ncbi:pyrimidine utilization protein D [Niveispirillum sp. KHB5.9]|uniref:pyrimidine utilization protein D n=1 Tax=Niveispirillum sp. KHB5.9 TaxID=3400269 RepID=UPI003A83DB8C
MHVEIHGRGDADAPVLILSSGLGGSAGYWASQIPALGAHFKVVTYDHRGTGRTGGTVPEGGGIAAMADDVLEIADRLGVERFSLMGHALGGLIGLDLALRAPGRIDRLVLINAWSKADPHSGRCFDVRLELLAKSGVPMFVKAQPLFLYPAIWMAENASRLDAEEVHGIAHFQGEVNIRRRIAALRAFDVDMRLGEVTAPTLVVATKDDLLVPYSRSLRLVEGLPDAKLVLTDFGGHAVNVVEPDGFNEAVVGFLRA